MRVVIAGSTVLGFMLSASVCLAHGYGGHSSHGHGGYSSHGCHGGWGQDHAARDGRSAKERAYTAYSDAIGALNDARELAVAEAVGAAEAAAAKTGS
jgi:hypothetical protein